jgi:superfamily II DNA or RNA helicase
MNRDLELRDYQLPAVDHIMETDRCVLAICPNGGKTEISIETIQRFLSIMPSARVLILTHSTNVLLDNYWDRLDEINVGFTYSKTFDDDCSVHICLPHNEKNIKGSYDYLIVDEAHENYLADRVQRIVSKISPTKQLLLTGTPSKFIRDGGYDIYVIAANEISDIWFAKLNIELVASNYNWLGHYDKDNEVMKTFNFTREDTERTLESVVLKLIDRVKTKFTAEQFNHPSIITRVKSWALTYKSIGKTMIVCRRHEQANLVNKILLKHGVDSIISHSICDPSGSRIKEFKSGDHNVLVVVNRARIGYNDNSLMNLIDLSGTHNPDIIYQMFCRTLRGTPDVEKFYLKVTPKESYNMALTEISVCAALMLTDKRYLTEYNGTNFSSIKIPIRHNPRVSEGEVIKDGGVVSPRRKRQDKIFVLPEFTHDIINVFRDVLHDLNNTASIYKLTTIGDVKHQLGLTNKRPVMTFEDLLESARGNIEVEV